MTVPASPPLLAGVIGADADTLPLEATTPAGSGALSYQSGWPPLTALPLEAGGVAPQREYFNKVNQLLSQHLVYLQAGGIYPWSDALDYPVNAHVLGSDGREYRALQQSGPDTPAGAQDPTTATGYWQIYGNDLFLCTRVFNLLTSTPPAGFVPCTGTLINNAATLYPRAYAFLQTAEGQDLCVAEATWQSMSTAVYYTDAAGNQYGWDGVGGVCKFVIDTAAGTIRVPDLRGLHQEAAGYNSLAVGQVARDEMREISGGIIIPTETYSNTGLYINAQSGVFKIVAAEQLPYRTIDASAARVASGNVTNTITFNIPRVAPTGPRTSPARYGVLPCVYLGS